MKHAVDRVNGLLACATLIIGVYVAASTIIMIVECWGPLPIEDSWDQLVSGRTITWSWLISQHNEHRVFLPRVVSIADYWLSAENSIIDFVVGIIMLGGLGVLIVRLSRGAGLQGFVGTIWTSGLTLALLFWSAQWQALIWGLAFVTFFGVLLAAAATFSVLALGPPTIAILGLVAVLEFITAYVTASGVVVPFLAVALAIWLKRPRTHLAILSITAVAVVVSYLFGYHTPPHHSDPLDAPAHLSSIFLYTIAYLGGPFGELIGWLLQTNSVPVAVLVGGTGVLLFAILGWRLIRVHRSTTPQAAVLFALASFAAATALLTSFGRVRFGIRQALESRYATQVLLFWLVLGLLFAAGDFGNSRRRKLAVMVLTFPVLFVVASSQPHFVQSARRVATEREAATPALLADVADPLLYQLYHSDRDIPLQRRPMLQSARTSIFSEDWTNWIGTLLADHAVFADASSCRGSFDKALSITDQTHPGWRALGRIRSGRAERSRHRIVLVDRAGLVVGYGMGGLGAYAEAFHMPAPDTAEDTRWIGSFAGSDPRTVAAYALLDKAACPLGTVREIGSLVRLELSNSRPAGLSAGGFVDSISFYGRLVIVSGWGMLQSDSGRVVIDTNLRIKSFALTTYSRPDVVSAIGDPRLVNAGIMAKLDLDENLPLPKNVKLCVWTDDPEFGRHLLVTPSQPWLCTADGQ